MRPLGAPVVSRAPGWGRESRQQWREERVGRGLENIRREEEDAEREEGGVARDLQGLQGSLEMRLKALGCVKAPTTTSSA